MIRVVVLLTRHLHAHDTDSLPEAVLLRELSTTSLPEESPL